MSAHEIGLKDVVESQVLLAKLPTIYLFVVSIEKVQPLSITLSHEIEETIKVLKKKAAALASPDI